ncbi:MAG: hypothetical protein ACPG7F_09640, partial [Aggregatilineales bacterium]
MMTQLSLPDTQHVPAWVYAALDLHSYRDGCKPGLQGMIQDYKELSARPACLTRVENIAFRNMRHLAIAWQRANFRTYLTALEHHVMTLERDVMRLPHSSSAAGQGRIVNTRFVIEEIQQRLAKPSHGYGSIMIMTKSQIRDTLDTIDCILTVIEYEG